MKTIDVIPQQHRCCGTLKMPQSATHNVISKNSNLKIGRNGSNMVPEILKST